MSDNEKEQALRMTSFTVEHVRGVIQAALRARSPPPWRLDLASRATANASATTGRQKPLWDEVAELTWPLIGTSGFTTFVKMDIGTLPLFDRETKAHVSILDWQSSTGRPDIEEIAEISLYAPPRLLLYENYEGTTCIA